MSHFINRLFQVLGTGVLVVALTNFLFGNPEPRWVHLLGIAALIGFLQAVFNVLYARWKADRSAVPGKSFRFPKFPRPKSAAHIAAEFHLEIARRKARQMLDRIETETLIQKDRETINKIKIARRNELFRLQIKASAAKRKRRDISTLPTPRRR